jgi:hypothetical protein
MLPTMTASMTELCQHAVQKQGNEVVDPIPTKNLLRMQRKQALERHGYKKVMKMSLRLSYRPNGSMGPSLRLSPYRYLPIA